MNIVCPRLDPSAGRNSDLPRSSKGRHARRGAMAVEMAVVAPVFFLFVLGLIEFSRAMMVQALLTSAAREGARAGSLDNSQDTDVDNAVDNYLSAGGISGANISVTPDPPSNAGYGQFVTVTVSVPYTSVSWLPVPQFLQSVMLTATSTVLRETSK